MGYICRPSMLLSVPAFITTTMKPQVPPYDPLSSSAQFRCHLLFDCPFSLFRSQHIYVPPLPHIHLSSKTAAHLQENATFHVIEKTSQEARSPRSSFELASGITHIHMTALCRFWGFLFLFLQFLRTMHWLRNLDHFPTSIHFAKLRTIPQIYVAPGNPIQRPPEAP